MGTELFTSWTVSMSAIVRHKLTANGIQAYDVHVRILGDSTKCLSKDMHLIVYPT